MPKILVFVPCEHVLIGQDNAASLIVLMHQFTLTPGADVPDPIPPNSATSMKWFIFAQWEAAPNEVGMTFEQKVQLVDRDNQQTGLQVIGEFIPEADKPLHRMIANLTFLPLLPAGDYRLQLFLRRAGAPMWGDVV